MAGDDIKYCELRIAEEERLAQQAPSQEAGVAHSQLAMLYRSQLTALYRSLSANEHGLYDSAPQLTVIAGIANATEDAGKVAIPLCQRGKCD